MNTPHSPTEQIPSTPVTRESGLAKKDFIARYRNQHKPVVIADTTQAWPAREKWSIEYLQESMGDTVVPVYNSSPATGKTHQHAAANEMPMRDYLELLKNGEKDLRIFFYNILAGAPQLIDDMRYPDIGLKFFKKLPVLFVGGTGARVQMHFDIDLANILLCHFGGRKRVLLFSPEQKALMYRVPFSFSSLHDIDFLEPDFDKYPALRQLNAECAELEHGDVLYIPSGYWHYVIYDEMSFSLSLRAYASSPIKFAQLLTNIFVLRTVDASMRKLVGQPWNERNERRAVEKTHRHLQQILP